MVRNMCYNYNSIYRSNKMKEFNLKAAKQGAEVITRAGYTARIICFDSTKESFPIVALVKNTAGIERVHSLTDTGKHSNCTFKVERSSFDLYMKPIKSTCWLNLHEPRIYTLPHLTRAEADKEANNTRVACIEVAYEEGEGL